MGCALPSGGHRSGRGGGGLVENLEEASSASLPKLARRQRPASRHQCRPPDGIRDIIKTLTNRPSYLRLRPQSQRWPNPVAPQLTQHWQGAGKQRQGIVNVQDVLRTVVRLPPGVDEQLLDDVAHGVGDEHLNALIPAPV